MSPPLGVYLHVPYCATICSYCDFPKYVRGDRAAWARTAIAELALTPLDRPVDTVFFGGGTPTLLDPDDLGDVLDALDLAPGAEVTVEANPDSVDPRSLARLRERGVTRISLGMQSAAPHVLALLGRTHDPARPPQAAVEARAAGFEHVSLDLIYGAPNETDADWRATVEAALAAGPDHVSAYGLTIAPGTRLHARIRHGELAAPDEDALADRYLLADALLRDAGLEWYEVSNWAAGPDARCRHNVGYWRGGEWLGVGPGAHSAIGGRRWWNVRHPKRWAAMVGAGVRPEQEGEDLDPQQLALERLMLEVRTREGIDPARARGGALDGLLDGGVLTLRGRLLADLVTRSLAG
jgi:oxygen-independent coproporphyrinogen-3 oxidase